MLLSFTAMSYVGTSSTGMLFNCLVLLQNYPPTMIRLIFYVSISLPTFVPPPKIPHYKFLSFIFMD